jgi:hypothetical protein
MESDRILARAEELLDRVSRESRTVVRSRQRQLRVARQRATRMIVAGGAVLAALFLYGLLIAPLGVTGVIVGAVLLIAALATLAVFPRSAAGMAEGLPDTKLAMLPLSAEEWLATKRRQLPAPAQRLIDGIGLKLEILSEQLRVLDDNDPAASGIRRLLADELPELVNGYQRVPPPMRKQAANGMSPDRQLIEGLNVVDTQLKRMSEQLASGDVDKLATQGRYLELKYQGDSAA